MALHRPVAPFVARPDSGALGEWAARFNNIHVDLGTGDGKYAVQLARRHPDTAVIALDTCLDHLRGAGKRQPANLRYVQADALAGPGALVPAADTVTVNFPYGSLLRGLVDGGPGVTSRLDALLAPGSRLAVRVNATAFVATGLDPVTGPAAIAVTLRQVPGLRVAIRAYAQPELRAFPSSWAKRIGYGKPTSAHLIEADRA